MFCSFICNHFKKVDEVRIIILRANNWIIKNHSCRHWKIVLQLFGVLLLLLVWLFIWVLFLLSLLLFRRFRRFGDIHKFIWHHYLWCLCIYNTLLRTHHISHLAFISWLLPKHPCVGHNKVDESFFVLFELICEGCLDLLPSFFFRDSFMPQTLRHHVYRFKTLKRFHRLTCRDY